MKPVQQLLIIFGLAALGLTSCETVTPPVEPPIPPTAGAASRDAEAPLGFWQDQASGLYVSVEELTTPDDLEDYHIRLGTRAFQIGGPPPRAGRADDIFFPSEVVPGDLSLGVRGHFNWEGPENQAGLLLKWTGSSVTLVVTDPGGQLRYQRGAYELKRVY